MIAYYLKDEVMVNERIMAGKIAARGEFVDGRKPRLRHLNHFQTMLQTIPAVDKSALTGTFNFQYS
jgi:hypothetical protein